MKQHIERKQLEELTSEQKKKLMDWYEPKIGDLLFDKYHWDSIHDETELIFLSREYYKVYCAYNLFTPEITKFDMNEWKEILLPLLSIGQMIEFLGFDLDSIRNEGTDWVINQDVKGAIYEWGKKIELCDALWQSVKEKLNNL